jgi:hypothetical protein
MSIGSLVSWALVTAAGAIVAQLAVKYAERKGWV